MCKWQLIRTFFENLNPKESQTVHTYFCWKSNSSKLSWQAWHWEMAKIFQKRRILTLVHPLEVFRWFWTTPSRLSNCELTVILKILEHLLTKNRPWQYVRKSWFYLKIVVKNQIIKISKGMHRCIIKITKRCAEYSSFFEKIQLIALQRFFSQR